MNIYKEIVHASPGCSEKYLSNQLLSTPSYSSANVFEGAYCRLDSQFWIQRIANRGFSVLVLSLSGCAEFTMDDGTQFYLQPGEAFLSSAQGQAHLEKTSGNEIWESIWMNFEGSTPWYIPSIEDYKVYPFTQKERLKEYFLSAIEEAHYFDPDSPVAQELYAHLFLITLKRSLEWSEEQYHIRYRRQFAHLWQKVTSSTQLPWTIDDLCSEMNLSRAHLTRLCRQLYNTSPKEYVKRIKLDYAKIMIESSDYSFSDISELVGYATPSTFSTIFKQFYGISPREARRNKQRF
jgi:AraC-like DNA-binding protein